MEENNKTAAIVSDESPVVNCGSVLTLSCGGGSAGSDDTETRMKRKRGRPRKHDPAHMESHPLALVSSSFSPNSSTKRRRGRPKGSGKLQVLASLGKFFLFKNLFGLFIFLFILFQISDDRILHEPFIYF